MKTRIFLFIGLFLLSYSNLNSQEAATKENPAPKSTIRVLSTPDLYNLTILWAGEYGLLNPNVNIEVTTVPGAGIAGMLQKGNGIGFITNESDPGHYTESAWKMVVGRDVIVPVINSQNPFRDELRRKGVSPAAFAGIIKNPEKRTWGNLLENGRNVPLNLYVVNDPAVTSDVADFLRATPGELNMITVENGTDMKAAIAKDPNAIGFCRMVNILDDNSQALSANISLLPIDRNGNGKIDYMEDIYADVSSFTRGVWIGKYPKALTGNIYAVCAEQPKDKYEAAFLTWVLTNGQEFLNRQGYSDLVSSERLMQLDKLNYAQIKSVAGSPVWVDVLKLVFLMALAVFAIGLIVYKAARSLKTKTPSRAGAPVMSSAAFDENSLSLPKGLYFDKTHTWAFMEKDGVVKLGIDDFLSHVTGRITRIEMKNPGDKVKKGDPLLTIVRNGKHLHLYAPVSGTILAQNTSLAMKSSLINTAPYSEGWVYKIEPAKWLREIQFLSMSDKYKEWLKSEFSRLKDFFAVDVNAGTWETACVTMQDGGTIADGILADLDPKVWEDFQTNFIDNAK